MIWENFDFETDKKKKIEIGQPKNSGGELLDLKQKEAVTKTQIQ